MKQQGASADNAISPKESSQSGKTVAQTKIIPFFTRVGRNIANIFQHGPTASSQRKSSLKGMGRRVQSVGDILNDDVEITDQKPKDHGKKEKKVTEKPHKVKVKKSAKATPDAVTPTQLNHEDQDFLPSLEPSTSNIAISNIRPSRSLNDLLNEDEVSDKPPSRAPPPPPLLKSSYSAQEQPTVDLRVDVKEVDLSQETISPEVILPSPIPKGRTSTLFRPVISNQINLQAELEKKLLLRKTIIQNEETQESSEPVSKLDSSRNVSPLPKDVPSKTPKLRNDIPLIFPPSTKSRSNRNSAAIPDLSPTLGTSPSPSASPSSPVLIRLKPDALQRNDSALDCFNELPHQNKLYVDHSIAKSRISMASPRKANRRMNQEPISARRKTVLLSPVNVDDENQSVEEQKRESVKVQGDTNLSTDLSQSASDCNKLEDAEANQHSTPTSDFPLHPSSKANSVVTPQPRYKSATLMSARPPSSSSANNKSATIIKANSSIHPHKPRPIPSTSSKPSSHSKASDISKDDSATSVSTDLRKQDVANENE